MTSSGNRDLMATLKKGCLAYEELILKEGAVVMFVKNNHNKGYVNGTMGKVVGFDEIYLSKSFAFGMGYVALSRVKSLEGIKLMGINQQALLVDGEITRVDSLFRKLPYSTSADEKI